MALHGKTLTNFQSDGCTWWPDLEYGYCCVQHDWELFSKEVSTIEAHFNLGMCVSENFPVMGLVMFLGVLVFYPVYKLLQKLKLVSKNNHLTKNQ